MNIAVTVILLAATTIFTFLPLFKKLKIEQPFEISEASSAEDLSLRRKALEEALDELDYDLSMGKISQADYADLKEKYAREAILLSGKESAKGAGKDIKKQRGE